MKAEERYYWLFVESRTRVLSKRLNQVEAEEFIVGLGEKDISSWWAWNPLFKDWISLKKIVDFKDAQLRLLIQLPQDHKSQKRSQRQPKAGTQTTHIPLELSEVKEFLRDEAAEDVRDFHGDDLSPNAVPKPPKLGLGDDRRKSDRVAKKVEVIIATGGKVFKTHTQNVSNSGVLLEKEIPIEMKKGPFEIVFTIYRGGVKKQLVFHGHVLSDAVDRRRLVFGTLTKDNVMLVEELKMAD